MFSYDKSSSSIEYLEQNIKYKTQNLHAKLNTANYYVTSMLARSSGLPFNGIFPIVGQVLISQLCLNNTFWN